MSSPSQIAPVLRFLPIFEQPGFKAGERDKPKVEQRGVLVMPGLNYAGQVGEFVHACYDAGLILKDFDWQAWIDVAMSYVDRAERVDGADFKTLCKLLTAHIRGDRFTEGHLLEMFENGHIVRLLRRLKEVAEGEVKRPMLGWRDLREQIALDKLGFICPVAGCGTQLPERQRGHFVFNPRFCCPEHQIVFSPSTFQYEEPERNFLWGDYYSDLMNLTSKRESHRLGRDNSEDAVTWNVFRFLERERLLIPYLTDLAGMPLTQAKAVFWSHDRETNRPWQPLWDARRKFEADPSKGSEPDLIVLTDRCLFIIEAKLMAKNKTKPSSPVSQKKYEEGGDGWWMKGKVFCPGAGYVQIAEQEQKYELMRFWLLGTWMAGNSDFRLVNLLRENDEDEKDIEVRFGKYLADNPKRQFQRTTWEGIYRFIRDKAPQSDEKERILRYFKEKTVGYKGGILQRAFAV